MKLVDLWLAPLRAVEVFINWFKLDHYEVWDKDLGKWVDDPSVIVNPDDQMHYTGISLFIAVFGICLIAKFVLILVGI